MKSSHIFRNNGHATDGTEKAAETKLAEAWLYLSKAMGIKVHGLQGQALRDVTWPH